ncbi:hypothetical protein H5410_043266 [Solanum commersonii]|uniref:Uncharacterized protein n=1 Tax=Solanum commersonii TaxID=4109 RepID=A0A9J5XZS7_SOLCO|nr:hypothetical protein H5410_043266 [Solanum commersonii]
MDFMKSKKETSSSTTYSSVLIDDENIEVFDMNDKKEVILLLEESDLKWRNEPWQIMARYLDTVSYTATAYKYRMHYEMILSSTGCEFQHFYPVNTKKVYNFSKLIIKRIITPEEWEFSIPWIMKWSVEVRNTLEGFPCLQRVVYTKFWSKLLQKSPEGKLHGQEIMDLINVTISKYHTTPTMVSQIE